MTKTKIKKEKQRRRRRSALIASDIRNTASTQWQLCHSKDRLRNCGQDNFVAIHFIFHWFYPFAIGLDSMTSWSRSFHLWLYSSFVIGLGAVSDSEQYFVAIHFMYYYCRPLATALTRRATAIAGIGRSAQWMTITVENEMDRYKWRPGSSNVHSELRTRQAVKTAGFSHFLLMYTFKCAWNLPLLNGNSILRRLCKKPRG